MEGENGARKLRHRKPVEYSDVELSRSRRNSSVKASTVPELAGIREGERETESDEENEDTFAPSSALCETRDTAGKDMFGFQTPRKGAGSMAAKVAEELGRTPLSEQNTPRSDRKTPSKAQLSTPNKTPSRQSTPAKGILRTPTSGRKRGAGPLEPDTPLSSRKRVKASLVRISEAVESKQYSEESDSGEEDGDSAEETAGPVLRGPPATPRTPARRGRRAKAGRELNQRSLADGYFSAHSEKVLTSDHTLARLHTPRLCDTEVTKLLRGARPQYEAEVRELLADHRVQFPKWRSLLQRGFSIVCYGLGSKKSLLHTFHEEFLLEEDCVVVNGFFPSLTLKQILSTISEEILELGAAPASTSDHLAEITSNLTSPLFLLVHNIDGPTLRSSKVQAALSDLASHPLVHLVCSIDHINAPLIWDQHCLAQLNLLWFDCTTFLPYTEEAGGADSLMVKKTGQLALASLASVWASLTPNAKKIYTILLRYQLDHGAEVDNYAGLAFMELYRQCRTQFLVASDLALRAQLTEFRDHKLVRSKKGTDGGEYLTLPLDINTITAFLETVTEN